MEFTKKELERYKEMDKKFRERLVEVLNITTEIETGKSPVIDEIDSYEFCNKSINASVYVSSNCSCCNDEYEHYSIPESYLYDLDIEKLKKEIEEKNVEKISKEKELKKKALVKEEEREREMLKKLQEKYVD